MFLCRLGHFGPMLVGPGQKESVVTDEAVPASDGVCVNRAVGVAQVRDIVDVVDRSRDVEAGHPCIVPVRSDPLV